VQLQGHLRLLRERRTVTVGGKWFKANTVKRMDMLHAAQREKAKQHFDSVEDIDAEIDRHIQNVRNIALRKLIDD
jgi:hypothetical protein